MPYINRYSDTIQGAITFIGNTVGLSKAAGTNLAGTLGSIGAFTSLNTGLVVGDFPAGTTLNISQNGSAAQLGLPPGSTVVYAELVWGGNYFGQNGNNGAQVSVQGLIDNPVTFTTPAGATSISGDPATAQTATRQFNPGTPFDFILGFYERSADVTALVQAGGDGTYSVEGIPGLTAPIDNDTTQTNHAGWSLAIVYQNAAVDYKNINVWVGAEFVNLDNNPAVDTEIGGFVTPPTGTVHAKLFVSSQEGDANIPGDQLQFGPSLGSLTALSGPNNPVNNFFGSQINGDDGLVNTAGTFGNRNQNVLTATNMIAGRQGWDITSVDVSPYIAYQQTDAAIRFTTQGDAYMPNMFGLEIDAAVADLAITKTVSPTTVKAGEQVTYTIVVENLGITDAANTLVTDLGIQSPEYSLDGGLTWAPWLGSVNLGIVVVGVPVTLLIRGIIPSSTPAGMHVNTATVTSDAIDPNLANNTAQATVIVEEEADIYVQKTVNAPTVSNGDTLIYTIEVGNNGPSDATSVLLEDVIPLCLENKEYSLDMGGTWNPWGIAVDLGTIISGGTQMVLIRSTVGPLCNGTLTNIATVTSTTPDPDYSNNTSTVDTQAIIVLNVQKAVDKAYANRNDVLLYTVTVENTTGLVLNDVLFQDNIPFGTTFVPGSVTVDTGSIGDDPSTGITIQAMNPGQVVTITWQVQIDNSLPVPNPIPNIGTITTPGSPSQNTNEVTTQVNYAELTEPGVLVKTVDKAYADIGDVLTYTITTTNTGNVAANNVVVTDSIPSGTSLVPGSITASVAHSVGAPDVTVAITNPVLPGASITVTYQVVVDVIPVPNPIPNTADINYTYTVDPADPDGASGAGTTNEVTTQVNHANLIDPGVLVKAVDKAYADIGDILTYTITTTNTGNVVANNVVVTDSIPSGTTLVPGSITANVAHSVSAPDVTVAITNPVLPGASFTVTYQVVVDVIPVPNPIPNTADINYTYTVDPANVDGASGSGTTNEVTTQVNHANLIDPGVLVKAVDKAYADIGDILTYTITTTNTGNVAANNVVVTDSIPSGTSLVPGSITANVAHSVSAPDVTVAITNPVLPGASFTVTYQVVVDVIPVPNPIPNTADINYTYTVDPANVDGASGSGTTNEVTTQVNHANLIDPGVLVKAVDKAYADIGDILTYTITTTNTGNVGASNVVVTDSIPSGTTLVPGSITASVPHSIGAPNVTVAISNPVLPGASFTVTYQVVVDVIPVPNPIPNTADINYTYTVDPANVNGATGSGTTNEVTTQVNHADLIDPGALVKAVDKAYADVGEILTYTITTTNTGNVAANNVIVTDSIPSGTSLVPGSITANVAHSIGVPNVTVALTNPVLPGASFTVTYQVVVDVIPVPNPIPNTADINYTYTVDPNNPDSASGSGTTNEVTTQVNHADLNDPGVLVKTVDKAYADIGDILTYTITTTNTGNVAANNVVVTDSIPSGTSLVPGSITASVAHTIGAPDVTVAITNPVLPGASMTVTFQVLVDEIPVPNPIPNTAVINYTYTVDPANPDGVNGNGMTNEVITQVNHAELTNVKAANKVVTTEADTILYTVMLTNTGNTVATDVVLRDTLPAGTTFIPGSIKINGQVVLAGDPATGIDVGSIAAGATATITFRVRVGQNPPDFIVNTAQADYQYEVDPALPPKSVTIQSNPVSIETIISTLVLEKSADQSIVAVGEIVTYTIRATNTGEIELDTVIIKDLLNPALDFVEGSVMVDGWKRPLDNILTGVVIQKLPIGGVVEVTFQAKVVQKLQDTIDNQSTAVYKFKDLANKEWLIKETQSNIVILEVQDPKLVMMKEADKTSVSIGDQIIYKVTMINTGDTPLYNVIFKDQLSEGVVLVKGSFKINGIVVNDVNLEQGVNVGVIGIGETVIILYQVEVIAGTCDGYIRNSAQAVYNYVLANGKTGERTTETAQAAVATNISTFKQVTYNYSLTLPRSKPSIEEVDEVTAKVTFIDSYILNTLKVQSIEGQKLNGKKLITHSEIEISIEYTADKVDQAMHSAEWRIPVSDFVILPVDYEDGQEVQLKGEVEAVEVQSISDRDVDVSLVLLIVAEVL